MSMARCRSCGGWVGPLVGQWVHHFAWSPQCRAVNGFELRWYTDKPARQVGKRRDWNLAVASLNGVVWLYRNREWIDAEDVAA